MAVRFEDIVAGVAFFGLVTAAAYAFCACLGDILAGIAALNKDRR